MSEYPSVDWTKEYVWVDGDMYVADRPSFRQLGDAASDPFEMEAE